MDAQLLQIEVFRGTKSLSDPELIEEWMVSDNRKRWITSYLNDLGVPEEEHEKYRKKWNYCTGGPDSWGGVYLGTVCERHDLEYSYKGNRKENDRHLKDGIKNEILEKGNWFIRKTAGFVSRSFYTVVRSVGWKFKTKKFIMKMIERGGK